MKKLFTVLFAVLLVLTLTGCQKQQQEEEKLTPDPVTAKNNYADFTAAKVDDELELLMSVQAHQNWWDDNGQGKVTVYGQDDDGGYYVYEMACPSENDANVLTDGALIRVKGYKAEWSGELELIDATYEFVDVGPNSGKVYDPKDVTSEVGTDELIKDMNKKIAINGIKIVAQDDGQPINIKQSDWDQDIYIRGEVNGTTIDLCVESQVVEKDAEIRKVAENLKIGDTIDIIGFLYWYNGANPHVTSITIK